MPCTTLQFQTEEIQLRFPSFLANGWFTPLQVLTISHKANDQTHFDSAVFSNPDLLNILPNPYGDQIQQEGHFAAADWASKTFTVQAPSATAASQAKRTLNPNRRRLSRL